ncbi:hypothetical protein CPB83DRAFT_921353 [Crepidotus variabilis]|uniref:Uncharacterized protein n=1 Tax=Crepidotus variabilis TaxID=179855 RepID=A0A9P6E3H2_9AGAR|nr:hypothetical protein CPB83DRAFT_921353 [Crepidotus variabilis]
MPISYAQAVKNSLLPKELQAPKRTYYILPTPPKPQAPKLCEYDNIIALLMSRNVSPTRSIVEITREEAGYVEAPKTEVPSRAGSFGSDGSDGPDPNAHPILSPLQAFTEIFASVTATASLRADYPNSGPMLETFHQCTELAHRLRIREARMVIIRQELDDLNWLIQADTQLAGTYLDILEVDSKMTKKTSLQLLPPNQFKWPLATTVTTDEESVTAELQVFATPPESPRFPIVEDLDPQPELPISMKTLPGSLQISEPSENELDLSLTLPLHDLTRLAREAADDKDLEDRIRRHQREHHDIFENRPRWIGKIDYRSADKESNKGIKGIRQVRIVVNSRTSARTLDVKDDHADKLSAFKHAPQNPLPFVPQKSFPPWQNPSGDSSRGSFKKRNRRPYSQKQKQEYAAAKAQNSTEHSKTINMIVEDFDLTPVVSPEDDYTMINLTTYPDDDVITLHPVATPETNPAPSAARFLPLRSRIADLSPRGIMYHYDHLAPTPPASPSVYPSFNAGKSLLERMAVPISMESLRSAELSSISHGFSDNADISPLIFTEPDQLPEFFDPEEGMTLDEPYSAPTPEYIPTEALTSSSNPASDEPLSGELQKDEKVPLEARHGRHVDGYAYNYPLDNWPINTRSKEDALLELKYSTEEEWKIKNLNIKDLDYFITYDSNDDDSKPDDDGDVMDYCQDYRERQIAEVVMHIIKRQFYNADVNYHIPDKKLKIKEIMEYIADQVTTRQVPHILTCLTNLTDPISDPNKRLIIVDQCSITHVVRSVKEKAKSS